MVLLPESKDRFFTCFLEHKNRWVFFCDIYIATHFKENNYILLTCLKGKLCAYAYPVKLLCKFCLFSTSNCNALQPSIFALDKVFSRALANVLSNGLILWLINDLDNRKATHKQICIIRWQSFQDKYWWIQAVKGRCPNTGTVIWSEKSLKWKYYLEGCKKAHFQKKTLHFGFVSFGKKNSRSHVLLWSHWYLCFGLLVKPPLGFKTRVGSLIHTWQRHIWYTFAEIHLWHDT